MSISSLVTALMFLAWLPCSCFEMVRCWTSIGRVLSQCDNCDVSSVCSRWLALRGVPWAPPSSLDGADSCYAQGRNGQCSCFLSLALRLLASLFCVAAPPSAGGLFLLILVFGLGLPRSALTFVVLWLVVPLLAFSVPSRMLVWLVHVAQK